MGNEILLTCLIITLWLVILAGALANHEKRIKNLEGGNTHGEKKNSSEG